MKKYWTGVFGQVRAQQKRFIRDKMSLFFTFLFPLIFLLVFGSIFNNQSTSFDIAIINNSQTEFAKNFVKGAKENAKDSILKIKDVKDMDEARRRTGLHMRGGGCHLVSFIPPEPDSTKYN